MAHATLTVHLDQIKQNLMKIKKAYNEKSYCYLQKQMPIIGRYSNLRLLKR